jgi:hypothetical protein
MEKFKNQESVWQKVKKIGEIAAFVALLGATGTETGLAQEKGKESESNLKNKIEQLKLQTAAEEKTVETMVDQKGITGKYGEEMVKKFRDPVSGEIVVGYDKDGKKPIWISFETPDAVQRYFDAHNNGTLDRVILNKTSDPVKAKSGFNDLDMFQDAEGMAKDAETESSLEPEQKTAFFFHETGGEPTVQSIDFNNGEKAELTGSEANEFTSKLQATFLNHLKDFEPNQQK